MVVGLLLGVLVLGGAAAGAAWYLLRDAPAGEPDTNDTTGADDADAARIIPGDEDPRTQDFSSVALLSNATNGRSLRVSMQHGTDTAGAWEAQTGPRVQSLGILVVPEGPSEVVVEETGRATVRKAFNVADCDPPSVSVTVTVNGTGTASIGIQCGTVRFAEAAQNRVEVTLYAAKDANRTLVITVRQGGDRVEQWRITATERWHFFEHLQMEQGAAEIVVEEAGQSAARLTFDPSDCTAGITAVAIRLEGTEKARLTKRCP